MSEGVRTGVVLDFFTITNPALLFESLTVFRQTHPVLLVVDSSIEHVEIDWPDNAVGDIYYDFRDPEILTFLSSDWDKNDLTLDSTNLLLALQLFQHAVREGVIRVCQPPSSVDNDVEQTLGRLSETGHYLIDYPNHGGRNAPITIAPGVPWTVRDDLSVALTERLQLATGNSALRAAADPLTKDGVFAKVSETELREVLPMWHPTSQREIFAAIDAPALLPGLIEALKALLEEKAYQKDLHLFLPRFLLDTVTLGAASVIEMLYRIYTHNRDRGKT